MHSEPLIADTTKESYPKATHSIKFRIYTEICESMGFFPTGLMDTILAS